MSSKIEVGSRVIVGGGKKGEVMFIGKTKFSEGDWVGVKLDTPDGKNDGTVGEHRYFICEPLHGLFVKIIQVRLDTAVSESQNKLGELSFLKLVYCSKVYCIPTSTECEF